MKPQKIIPLLVSLFLVFFPGLAAGTLDWNDPWPPSSPFPQFLQYDYLPLAAIESLTKFRSGIGHDYSDQYETNRSMKHYYVPKPQYREQNGTDHDLKVYSPVNGEINEIFEEGHTISTGEFLGYQVHITPDGYPMFDVVLFHINILSGVSVGQQVTAGQWLGYADMRESYTSDIAVACVYGAPPEHYQVGPEYPDRGLKYLSVFQVMDDALFSQYQKRGVASRSQPIITKEYRDAHPVTDWNAFYPEEFVVLKPGVSIGQAIMLLLTD